MKAVTRHRRSYVKDPDVCRTCYYGQQGCRTVSHLGAAVLACIGYLPAARRA